MEPDALSMFFIGKGSCSNLHFPCTQSDTNVALTNHYSRPALATIWPPQKKQLSFFFFFLWSRLHSHSLLLCFWLLPCSLVSLPPTFIAQKKGDRLTHLVQTSRKTTSSPAPDPESCFLGGRECVCVTDVALQYSLILKPCKTIYFHSLWPDLSSFRIG